MKIGKLVVKIQDGKPLKTGVIAEIGSRTVQAIPYVDHEWFETYKESTYVIYWTDGERSVETAEKLTLVEDLHEKG